MALKTNQIQAISLLSEGVSITATSERIGIDRSTLHNWLKHDDEFLLQLNTMKAECLETAKAKLNSSVTGAIDALLDIATNGVSELARINAIKLILDIGGVNAETMRDAKPLPLTLDGIQQQKAMQSLNEKINFFN